MFKEIPELYVTQQDGSLPTTVVAGGAPGESGISIFCTRFEGAMHLNATSLRHHIICFQFSGESRFECRIADQRLSHRPSAGSLAICPAGADCAADSDRSVDAILVIVDPGRFSLTAAENSALSAELIARLSGYDQALLKLARKLVSESTSGYPNGPLFWNEAAGRFISDLVDHHSSAVEGDVRGRLGKEALKGLKDYIVAHLDESIEVAALAKIAGRSPFHFTRVFAKSVGTTPHRYVVHLRLQRAIALVRDGQSGLAEIAASTGFADQSHLSRWVRRVHGVSLTQLAD
jgi:AraC family transcriptional regulator